MAAKKRAGGANRSAFIREKLGADPKTKLKDIQEAWTQEGHPDDITGTLYYQVKKSMGLSTKRKKKRAKSGSAPAEPRAAAPAASSGSDNGYASIERSLDKLIAQASEINDNKLAEDLRIARRRASAKLV